jgi:hypothetical protein
MGVTRMDITRRTLARVFAATAAAPALVPVDAAAAPAPPQGAPAGAEADLNTAREMMRSDARRLAQVHVPMSTEPAFRFKA